MQRPGMIGIGSYGERYSFYFSSFPVILTKLAEKTGADGVKYVKRLKEKEILHQ